MDHGRPGSSATYTFEVRPERLMAILWGIVSALVLIHVVLTLVHYRVHELPWLSRQIFDVDEEDSLPTWYSAVALLLTAGVTALYGRHRRAQRDPLAWYWLGLGLGFAGLSLDEVAGLHETLNSAIDMSWAIPGAIVAALVAGMYLQFLLSVPRAVAFRFVLAGAIYLGGALGVEFATEPYLENDQLDTLAYNLWTAVEEGMEMGGVLLFLGTVLRVMQPAGTLNAAVRVTGSR